MGKASHHHGEEEVAIVMAASEGSGWRAYPSSLGICGSRDGLERDRSDLLYNVDE